MKKILMLAFLLLSIEPSYAESRWVEPPAAAPPPQSSPSEVEPSRAVDPGEVPTHTMTMDGLGCKSREDAEKIVRMVVTKDNEAFQKFQITHLTTGDCRWFKKGERLYNEEFHLFSDSTCMRARGDTDCYWLNKGWMTE